MLNAGGLHGYPTRLLRMAMRRWLSAVWPKGETVTLLRRRGASGLLKDFAGGGVPSRWEGMMGDRLLYLLGRCYGGKITASFSARYRHEKDSSRAEADQQRHPYLFVIGTRFYGAASGWLARC